MLSYKDIIKFEELRNQNKYKCSCGTKSVIPPRFDKIICRNCGHWVYKSKKQEFKEKLMEKMKYGRR